MPKDQQIMDQTRGNNLPTKYLIAMNLRSCRAVLDRKGRSSLSTSTACSDIVNAIPKRIITYFYTYIMHLLHDAE